MYYLDHYFYQVTCVAELPHAKPSGQPGPLDQMVVGLECELTGGMLCIFNLAGSRVLRAINVPSKVTALTIVNLGGKATGPLHQCFNTMSGIAAVGTNDGQVLLIDLRRNDCDDGTSKLLICQIFVDCYSSKLNLSNFFTFFLYF